MWKEVFALFRRLCSTTSSSDPPKDVKPRPEHIVIVDAVSPGEEMEGGESVIIIEALHPDEVEKEFHTVDL